METKGKLKHCPFCNSSNIDYSIKIASRTRLKANYHICMYCKDCNCYGRRVRITLDNNKRSNIENDINIRKMAEDAWNNRV